VRNECYKGVYHYGKHRTVRTPGREKKRRDTALRKENWIAVPVADSGIPHELIDAARGKLDARYRPRPQAQSFFELGGMLVCSECGCKITGYSGGFDRGAKLTATTSAMRGRGIRGCALMVPVGTRTNWNAV
jgi:hypothetical protein